MKLISELGVLVLVCLAGEGLSALIPMGIPASVISLVLLLLLLLSGTVKERHIQQSSAFLTENMGIFFVPASVGTLEYLDILKAQAVPFLAVTLLSTPVVYFITAWTVRFLMKLVNRKEARHV